MNELSVDYYERKCFFKREQVPTQSTMKEKMGKPLAKVYFKSMNYKLKVLAGLEPPMKGGGSDWYMPPEEILNGRVVLKPISKEYLSKLSADGFELYTETLLINNFKRKEEEKRKVILENDLNWQSNIEVNCRQTLEDTAKDAAMKNTEAIQKAFRQFTNIYKKSINNIETILFDGAINEIERIKTNAYTEMQKIFKKRLQKQATILQDYYDIKLAEKKDRLKARFISNVEKSHKLVCDYVHNIKIQKHLIIEKLRQFLRSQNLACQVYVALKERESCKKELDAAQAEHRKKTRDLKEQIAMRDFEVRLAKEKERKRAEFNKLWQKKVCHVVKKLQMFVSFCLSSLPEYADFFIDMEKLMMLQLNDVIENPSVESIFERDEPEFHTPVPLPHPFYLFWDKDYKAHNVEPKLCPKHCTSSSSQLPVIIVNNRFIYAACDNFETFSSKVLEYVQGQRGDDLDFEDKLDYTQTVPVKYTSKERLHEIKLESSLLQVLQNEVPNPKKLPIECYCCSIPYCFCSPLHPSTPIPSKCRIETKILPSINQSVTSGNKLDTRSMELIHEREPKIESYLEYVTPKRCKCSKATKKHLEEHLPPYMRKMSKYESPRLPFYEICPLDRLKKIVKKAQVKRPSTPPSPIMLPKLRTIGTQYSDQEFDILCNCLSDDEVDKLLKELPKGRPFDESMFKIIGDETSHSFLKQRTSSVAMECAYTLRALLDDSPQLEEIFKNKDCHYD